jgi:hypothetical protein
MRCGAEQGDVAGDVGVVQVQGPAGQFCILHFEPAILERYPVAEFGIRKIEMVMEGASFEVNPTAEIAVVHLNRVAEANPLNA